MKLLTDEYVYTTGNLLQRDEVASSKDKLQQLEQKYQAQQGKLKTAQDDVTKARDALANLPAAPENTKPQQDALQARVKDLNSQVCCRAVLLEMHKHLLVRHAHATGQKKTKNAVLVKVAATSTSAFTLIQPFTYCGTA